MITTPIILTGNDFLIKNYKDCACPEPIKIFRNTLFTLDQYYAIPDAIFIELPNNYQVVYNGYSPYGPSVLNQAGFKRYKDFQQQHRQLISEFDFSLASQSLIIPSSHILEGIPPSQNTIQSFTAWLHVSNACNLDCPYCYVNKSPQHMQSEIGLQAIKQLFSTAKLHGIKKLNLKYAGGEASLREDMVRQLSNKAKYLAHLEQVELNEVLLSNGVYLKEGFVDWLNDSNIRLMISLDGIKENHDLLRPMVNGNGSFDKVEHTIDCVLLKRNFKPTISVTITQVNAPAMGSVMEWILDRDLPFSLNFYRANPLSKKRKDLELETQTIINGFIGAYAAIEKRLPERFFLDGLLDRFQAHAHTHTCGVGNNYVVIDHKGKVAQCQMHMNESVGDVYSPDLISILNTGSIQNLHVDEKEGCKDCNFRYRCGGGCPAETFRVTGRWDIKSPHCEIYKTLYPLALRLEGLRLLKINGL